MMMVPSPTFLNFEPPWIVQESVRKYEKYEEYEKLEKYEKREGSTSNAQVVTWTAEATPWANSTDNSANLQIHRHNHWNHSNDRDVFCEGVFSRCPTSRHRVVLTLHTQLRILNGPSLSVFTKEHSPAATWIVEIIEMIKIGAGGTACSKSKH